MNRLETYSYSKVKSFYNCPYGFYKHYYEKERTNFNHGTSEFGTFCHLILEKYAKGELGEWELLDYYSDHYDENVVDSMVLHISDDFSKDFSEMYFSKGYDYFQNFEGFQDLEVLEAEYDFNENVEDRFILTGKVDLICQDKNGDIVVIDHKSKGKFKNKAEQHEYARQLYLYAYAVFKKYGKFPKTLVFNMFRVPDWVVIPFNKDDYIEAMEWLKDSVAEIESCMDFYPITDTFFEKNFCEYYATGLCDRCSTSADSSY